MGNETPEARLKRLLMRSMRRGIKEMDIILQRFAETHLTAMTEAELTEYDALLHENDQELYAWVTGQQAVPEHFKNILEKITRTLPHN